MKFHLKISHLLYHGLVTVLQKNLDYPGYQNNKNLLNLMKWPDYMNESNSDNKLNFLFRAMKVCDTTDMVRPLQDMKGKEFRLIGVCYQASLMAS